MTTRDRHFEIQITRFQPAKRGTQSTRTVVPAGTGKDEMAFRLDDAIREFALAGCLVDMHELSASEVMESLRAEAKRRRREEKKALKKRRFLLNDKCSCTKCVDEKKRLEADEAAFASKGAAAPSRLDEHRRKA